MGTALKCHFSNNRIQFKDKVDDWREAIVIASEPLLLEGIIEKRYVEAMIDSINRLGDYVVLVPKVAMPHARPELGSLGTGVSILKLDEPVLFGENHMVYMIICLATKDNQSHLEVLQDISVMIDEEDKVDSLIAQNDKTCFMQLVEKYIKEEENQ